LQNGRDGPCGIKALNCHISAIGGEKAQRKHLHEVVYSTGHGSSVLARKLHRQLCMNVIVTSLRNGPVKLSRSSQRDGSDVSTYKGCMLS